MFIKGQRRSNLFCVYMNVLQFAKLVKAFESNFLYMLYMAIFLANKTYQAITERIKHTTSDNGDEEEEEGANQKKG